MSSMPVHYSNNNYVGRYAPSPTGLLHLGNARTALLAWLQIRKAKGVFLMRMEDLDPHRSKKHYADLILEDLLWLGLYWDEGVNLGGPHAPYVQSQRQSLYQQVVDQFIVKDLVYRCTCSRKDLAILAGAPHQGEEGPPYPGWCSRLTIGERLIKEEAKGQWSLRFRVSPGKVCFEDGLKGLVCQNVANAVGDFVVLRSDRVFAYQLAVVVDDGDMGVTHVLRGDDLLYSTPRQILLFQALNLPIPNYFHVPLLLGPDGSRLSKRHGDTGIEQLRRQGVQREKVLGFLGYSAGLLSSLKSISLQELLEIFDEKNISRQPYRICREDLDFLYS